MRRGRHPPGVNLGSGFPDLGVAPSKVTPIWLGSGTREEFVDVKGIKQIVPEDLHQNENVLAIERFESDSGPYEAQQKYVMAAECLEQAINLRRKFLGDLHKDFLASIERYIVNCNIWGITCLNSGQYTLSLELLKKAEVMTEAQNVPNFKRRVSLRAATFCNLCCYFRHRGKLNAALQFAEKALKIEQRYKDAEDPARTHLNYAVLLSMMNRHEEAVSHIESAIAVLHDEERQISYDHGDPEAWRRTSDTDGRAGRGASGHKRHQEVVSVLVVAYYNMWVELSRLSRRERGVDFILRAANISRRKLGATHALTIKMEESLVLVKEQLAKAPALAYAFDASAAGDGGPLLEQPHGCTAGSRPITNGSGAQLPPLEAWVPWSGTKPAHEGALDVLADVNLITLRYDTEPQRPTPRAQTEKAPFKRALKQLRLQENVYGRSMTPPAPQAHLADPLFVSRPKSEERGGYAGSPILQQQIHGVTPRMQSARCERDGTVSGCAFATADLGSTGASGGCGGTGGIASTVGLGGATGGALEAPAPSANLRAAYEYYRLRTQIKESLVGTTEEEAAAPPASSERLGAVAVFRSRLAQRRSQGLQVPTDSNRARAATRIQAAWRGYLVRVWSRQELALDSRRRRREEQLAKARGPTSAAAAAAAAALADVPPAAVTSLDVVPPSSARRNGAGPADMKRRVALRVVYAARKAFVEYGAAVKVQKAWRGWVTRRDICVEIEYVAQVTATRLQALFRRCRVIRHLCLQHAAAEAIQGPWRRWIARRRRVARKTSAVSITRAGQVYIVQRRLRLQHEAAVPLQCAVRGFLARRSLARHHAGALEFQKVFRGWRRWRRLGVMRAAACRLAALWRGHAVRKLMSQEHKAARSMQRCWRLFQVARRERRMQAAAAKIGTRWRSRGLRRRRPFRASAVKIQAFVRGVQVRERLRKVPFAALRIQAFWKSYRARCRFKTLVALAIVLQKLARWHLTQRQLQQTKAATIVCQRFASAFRTRRRLKRELAPAGGTPHILVTRSALRRGRGGPGHEKVRSCATRLQANWRSGRERYRLARQARAAQRIQTAFRASLCFRRYREVRAGALRVGGGWASHCTRQSQRRRVAAARVLGAAIRGHLCRRRLQRRRLATRTIKLAWRRYLACCRYSRMARAATRIQTAFRMRRGREHYLAFRNVAARGIQSAWRRTVRRRRYKKKQRLALALQAAWRGRTARAVVEKQRQASVAIQCQWRQRQRQRRKRDQQLRASLIQARVLGVLARERIRKQRKAAEVIRRFARGFLARRSCQRRAAACRLSAWLLGRLHRMRFLRCHRAAVVLQKGCRRRLARRRYTVIRKIVDHMKAQHRLRRQAVAWRKCVAAANRIQRTWRGVADRMIVSRQHVAATSLQRVARGWLALRIHLMRQRAATKIQAHWRGRLLIGLLKRKRLLQRALAGKIRCYVALTKEYLVLRQHAGKIYNVARTWLAKRQIHKADCAALEIQRVVRGHLARRYVAFIRDVAPLPIQCFIRRINARILTERKRMQAHLGELRGSHDRALRKERQRFAAATRIQACQRMRVDRRNYLSALRRALPKIQAMNRMVIDRAEYRLQRAAVVTMQKNVRAFCLQKLPMQHKAASVIQLNWRFHNIRKSNANHQFNDFILLERKARLIQASWRRYKTRWHYMRSLVGAVRIQAVMRMYLTRKRWKQQRTAVLQIQASLLKPFLARQRVWFRMQTLLLIQAMAKSGVQRIRRRLRLRSAIRIQAAWRSALCKRLVEKRQHHAAVRIQASMRMCFHRGIVYPRRRAALRNIQAHVRGFLIRKRMRERHAFALKIQQKVRLARFRRVMNIKRWLVRALQRIARARLSRRKLAVYVRTLQRMPARVAAHRWRHNIFKEKVKTVMAIQRIFRGRRVRRAVALRRRAAIMIQTNWRGFTARRWKPLRLQAIWRIKEFVRLWRRKREAEAHRVMYLKALDAQATRGPMLDRQRAVEAAATMQRFARGMLGRRRIWRMLEAATRIQTMARRRFRRGVVAKRWRALHRIQADLDGSYQRANLPPYKAKVLFIQSRLKGWLARRNFLRYRRAQLQIARACRGYFARRRHAEMQKEALLLTRSLRAAIAAMRHRRKRWAAMKIQAAWRGWLARDELKEWPRLATKIETAWRRFRERRRFLAKRRLSDLLFRAWIVRAQARQRKSKIAAVTTIAAAWRRCSVNMYVARLYRAAVVIQRMWRHERLVREYQDLVVEALAPASRMRHEYRAAHATIIQRGFRRWRARRFKSIVKTSRTFTALQARFRQRKAVQEVEALKARLPIRVSRMLSCQATLERDKRGRLTRYRLLQNNEEPEPGKLVRPIVNTRILLQRSSHALSKLIRPLHNFAKWKYELWCKLAVQRVMRGFVHRQRLRRQRKAAIKIQACWRRRKAAKVAAHLTNAVQKIQAVLAGAIDRRRLRREREGRRRQEAAAQTLDRAAERGVVSPETNPPTREDLARLRVMYGDAIPQ